MKLFTNTLFLILLLIILSVADVFIGSINLFNDKLDLYTLLVELRIPKTLSAFAVGSSLSLCGLVLQIIFRNPLAGPYVLGISSAASLFTSIGIMATGILNHTIWYHVGIQFFSITGAMCGIFIIMLFLRITSQITIILLIGLMLSQFYSAIQNTLSYISSEHSLKIYTLWTMGSIQNTNITQSFILLIISHLCLYIVLKHTKTLIIYITGDETASVMGISVHKIKKQLIILVALTVGIITAYCGPIAFVGMSIPILVRILNKTADIYKWTIQTYLYGAIFIITTDILNQLLFDGSVPLNILISMWAVPLMVWILLKQMKWVVN